MSGASAEAWAGNKSDTYHDDSLGNELRPPEILPACRELGVGVTACGVLSRGLLSGHSSAEREVADGDFRASAPRFTGENLGRNLALVESLREVADAKGATIAQIAIAWFCPAARTSFRSSGRAGASGSPKLWAHSSST